MHTKNGAHAPMGSACLKKARALLLALAAVVGLLTLEVLP